jgi:hypothetical protein
MDPLLQALDRLMSDTPRTDEQVRLYNCVRIDFARQLERENAELRDELETFRQGDRNYDAK